MKQFLKHVILALMIIIGALIVNNLTDDIALYVVSGIVMITYIIKRYKQIK